MNHGLKKMLMVEFNKENLNKNRHQTLRRRPLPNGVPARRETNYKNPRLPAAHHSVDATRNAALSHRQPDT
jgi:hypothetical protein